MKRYTSIGLAAALGAACVTGAGPASAANYRMACVERCRDAGFPTSANVTLTCNATDGFQAWFKLVGIRTRRFYWHNIGVAARYIEDSFAGSRGHRH